MSRAIFYNFKNIFKNTNINNGLPIEYKINILGIILAANFCYATITKEEVQINIQKNINLTEMVLLNLWLLIIKGHIIM